MMVSVLETTPKGSKKWFEVSYENEEIVYNGVPEKLIATWEKYGIPIAPGKVCRPTDGEAFLRAVARDFNGSMARSNEPEGESHARRDKLYDSKV